MTLVMIYRLVSRVEKVINNDLKSSLLGSDRPSGSYNSAKSPESWYALTVPLSFQYPPFSDILCRFGAMFAVKESDLMSVKRFPSQQKSSESVK